MERTSTEQRILEAALACIARWGVAKTTLDDVARQAGTSRATVYRAFPGGKDVILTAVAEHELARFFDVLGGRLEAAETLEDLLVIGITSASRHLRDHEALRYLFDHEPELVLAHFAFHRLDPVLAVADAFATPYLRRFLADDDASAVAEWVVRVVLSYGFSPSDRLDPTEEASARRLVRTYLLPGLAAGPIPSP
jgi:AcrR family transcriptional regulator